jgi:hypothetical protein
MSFGYDYGAHVKALYDECPSCTRPNILGHVAESISMLPQFLLTQCRSLGTRGTFPLVITRGLWHTAK